ncbi:DUF3592 domain-containing protein [Kosakonia sp. BK9b]|uniref:hypothetical protein n=1 Tax=Kosakonia sp. TaxID=1916651 RepID=UPI00289A1F90|nr:hypothetical protein [Kosakonia sp.]
MEIVAYVLAALCLLLAYVLFYFLLRSVKRQGDDYRMQKNWLGLARSGGATETVPGKLLHWKKTAAIKGNDHYYILTFTATLSRRQKRYRAAAVLSTTDAATLTVGLPVVVKYSTQSPKKMAVVAVNTSVAPGDDGKPPQDNQ